MINPSKIGDHLSVHVRYTTPQAMLTSGRPDRTAADDLSRAVRLPLNLMRYNRAANLNWGSLRVLRPIPSPKREAPCSKSC